jgi:quercetin dioxygenase-like cupin family protein
MTNATATETETIRLGQLELRFHANGGAGSENITAFEMTVPANAIVPGAHSHVAADELVLVLDGALTYTADGRRYVLRAGESAFCPHGAVHHFINEGTEPARAFVVLTPGTICIDYFRETAALVNAGGPPDRTMMREVMLHYGLVPA